MKKLLPCLAALFFTQAHAAPWGVENARFFDNLAPEDRSLGVDSGYDQFIGPLGSYSKNEWSANCGPVWPNSYVCGSFKLTGGPENGQRYPWVRVLGYDRTGWCGASNETDIGNGWCRITIDSSNLPYTFLPSNPAIHVPNPYAGGSYYRVDNVIVEMIGNNISVDYKPGNDENTLRPKSPGWTLYLAIKTSSVAAGDTYDFNAAEVDPATLRVGPGMAQVLSTQAGDIDADGDTDYVFGFNTGATGIGCTLPGSVLANTATTITIAGRTYSGDPVAGRDSMTLIDCEEPVLIDVDPFNVTNIVRPNDNYNLTVAILGMRKAQGDPADLFPENYQYATYPYSFKVDSLRFGPAAVPKTGNPIITDIDGDNNSDMLVNFNVFNAGIACGDTQLEMTGLKNTNIVMIGVDNIVTTDCETGGCHP
jgi:hypothetical protein